MKKIILFLLLSLPFFGFSQTKEAAYFRSFATFYGDPQEGADIKMSEPEENQVLIRFEGPVITIFSKIKQEFHYISLTSNDEYLSFYCSDVNGVNCNVIVFAQYPDLTYLIAVQYSDIIYYYACNKE